MLFFFLCYNYNGDNMKALTIKEPWATLIIEGYKKYEFRSWKTNYRGKLLIHAGLSLNKDMLNRCREYNLTCNNGSIIGEVDIVDCILVDSEFSKRLHEENSDVYTSDYIGLYAWKIENVIKYENPIPAKGKLGLWNYDDVK